MKFQKLSNLKRICAVLLGLVLLFGNIAIPAFAESNLTPDDKTFENGNIILHKQAERTAADEWKVHVKATIKDQPVEPPKLEVAFVLDASKSMRMCGNEKLHTLYYHTYHDFCTPICGNSEHEHASSCYTCGLVDQVHLNNHTECYYYDELGKVVNYTTRFELAKRVIANMESRLPEGTRVGRVVFNSNNHYVYWDGVSNITPQNDTYLMNGVRLALSKEGDTPCFTDDPTTKKILIIVTDGAATDNDYGASDPAFNNFRNNEGGIVYTVGFNHDDPNLSGMIANGGTYSRASNPDELETIFDQITYELTAMIVDPMGEEVDLKSGTTVQPDTSVSGDLTFDGSADTLYWNPTKPTDITNSSIEYTYTVKLGSGANMSAGVHTGVELNKDTYLYYGTSDNAIKEPAEFPQPIAEYAVSTLQVNWKAGSTDLRTPTATESVICDFGEPAFSTNYNDIPASITKDGVTYYYNSTEITKNGEAADAVTIADAAAFVVTHQYSEIATYQVTYEYTGEVPENAPSANTNNQVGLNAGDTVQVAAAPSLDGYIFSGWTVADNTVEIENGSFSMPASNVTLQGRWSKLNGYRVWVDYYTSTNGGTYVKDNAESIEIAKNLQTTDTNVSVDFSSALFWNGHIYGSPALAEGSAAAEISGNFINKIAPSDPTAEVIVNLFRDVRTTATVTVRYVDSEGKKLQDDTTSGALYVGDDYDVSAAKNVASITVDGVIYDFVSDSNAVYTGTVPANGLEITRTYKEHSKAAVVVHYVDEAGNKLQDDTTSGEIYVGADFDVSATKNVASITVDDVTYDFVSDDNAAYTGKVPADGLEITRVYQKKEVPNESKPESTTPNTGDQYFFLLASVMLLSACALIALTAKKCWKKVM